MMTTRALSTRWPSTQTARPLPQLALTTQSRSGISGEARARVGEDVAISGVWACVVPCSWLPLSIALTYRLFAAYHQAFCDGCRPLQVLACHTEMGVGCCCGLVQDQPAAAALQGTHRVCDSPVLPSIWQLPADMLTGHDPQGQDDSNKSTRASADAWQWVCMPQPAHTARQACRQSSLLANILNQYEVLSDTNSPVLYCTLLHSELNSFCIQATLPPLACVPPQIWDLREGQLFYTLHGHEGATLAGAFAPAGDYFASAGADEQVRHHLVPHGLSTGRDLIEVHLLQASL